MIHMAMLIVSTVICGAALAAAFTVIAAVLRFIFSHVEAWLFLIVAGVLLLAKLKGMA